MIAPIESAAGEDIIIEHNPDYVEKIVYCGRCGIKMVRLGLNRYYKCTKCEFELRER